MAFKILQPLIQSFTITWIFVIISLEWAVSGSRTHYMSRLGADLPLWAQNGACKKICWNPLSGRGGSMWLCIQLQILLKEKYSRMFWKDYLKKEDLDWYLQFF